MRLFLFVALFFLFIAAEATPNKSVYVVLLRENSQGDREVVQTIHTTLMAAEKIAKLANLEMLVSDEPIQDDIIVYALKSEEQKDLTLKMFDEEGYDVVAHRIVKVQNGNNYQALNVETLEDGEYILSFADSEGHTASKNITIKRKP